MKTKLHTALRTGLALISALSFQLSAFSQGTAFTYQGRLNSGGSPANGFFDITFSLWTDSSGTTQVGATLTNSAAAVSNGLFTVALNFGAGIFTGADRWLEIGVRTNGDEAFAPLIPRQPITAAPYAITAGNLSDTLPSANLSGTYASVVTLNNPGNSFSGGGAGLTALNASQLASGTVPAAALGNAWRIGGNAGTTPGTHFLGTTDNQALELKVNGVRGFRLQPGNVSPHVVGGGFSSVAAGLNAVTIGGGQENNVSSSTSAIGGGFRNFIGSGGQDSTIGGGQVNGISNNTAAATVAGGTLNTIGVGSPYAAIGGGRFNRISDGGVQATIGGGRNNLIDVNSEGATIAGGTNNLVGTNSAGATVGGGQNNTASNVWATVSGGKGNTAGLFSATVAGGEENTASNAWATVGGGHRNISSGSSATVGGGDGNRSTSEAATVGGGRQNTSSGTTATVGGGNVNTCSIDFATVGGGDHNTASGFAATVPGGDHNLADGFYSFAAGQQAKANHQGSFVWADSQGVDFTSTANDQFSIRAAGGVRVVGGDLTWSTGGALTDNQGGSLELGPKDINFGSTPFIDFHYGSGAVEDFNVRLINNGNGQLDIATALSGTPMARFNSGGLTVNGTFVSASDRNVKENFASVDAAAVLAKVVALPLQQWNYKADTERSRHLGPMAQDFHAAFSLGADDKHIATVDADGVALAAIQGLNQKLEERERKLTDELKRRDAENAELRTRLAALERIITKLNPKAI